jgi:hypothetical protein
LIRDGPAGSLSPGIREPVTPSSSALSLSTAVDRQWGGRQWRGLGVRPVGGLLRLAAGGEDRTMRRLPAPFSMAAPISLAMPLQTSAPATSPPQARGRIARDRRGPRQGPQPEWAETRRQAGLGRAGLFRPAR